MERRELYDVFLRGTPLAILEAITNPQISITKVARVANAAYYHTHTIIHLLEERGIVTIKPRTKRDKIVELTEEGVALLEKLLQIKEVCKNVR